MSRFTLAKVVASDADPREYRKEFSERGEPGFCISSSSLRDFNTNPRRWKSGFASVETKSTRWGNLLDTRFLTPHQFPKRYSVCPETYSVSAMKCPECGGITDSQTCRKCGKPRVPVTVEKKWDRGASYCAAWEVAQFDAGLEVVGKREVEEVDTAISRLNGDEIIQSWHNDTLRQVWVSAVWEDTDSDVQIPCKCLIDYVAKLDSEFPKSLGDLKSARSGLDHHWKRHVWRYGYHIQAAFNLDMYCAATGEDRSEWHWVGQENYPPYEPFRKLCSQDLLDRGRRSYLRALAKYARCLKSGKWGGYDDNADAIQGWSLVLPEPYMDYEDLSEAMAEDAELSKEGGSQEDDWLAGA